MKLFDKTVSAMFAPIRRKNRKENLGVGVGKLRVAERACPPPGMPFNPHKQEVKVPVLFLRSVCEKAIKNVTLGLLFSQFRKRKESYCKLDNK